MTKTAHISSLPPFNAEQPGTALSSASAPSAVPEPIACAVAKIEAATRFLDSRYIENLIVQTTKAAVLQAASPLCDRAGAAALAHCDVSQIDRAASAGIIKKHLRGDTPLYDKAEIYEAITSGRWRFDKKTKTTKEQ